MKNSAKQHNNNRKPKRDTNSLERMNGKSDEQEEPKMRQCISRTVVFRTRCIVYRKKKKIVVVNTYYTHLYETVSVRFDSTWDDIIRIKSSQKRVCM